jgi:hypothetical protein
MSDTFVFWLVFITVVGFVIAKLFFGPPQKRNGCRCGHTCEMCTRYREYVRLHKSPCPGLEKDYFFDDWDNQWIKLSGRRPE